MRGLLTFAAALLAVTTAPLSAENVAQPEVQVRSAAQAFMAAIGDTDKTALADHMIPEAMITVHNRMDPENPRVDFIPVSQHLERWAKGTRETREEMWIQHVLIDGNMAQVWGFYTFYADDDLSHCGINSLSMVKTDDGWKVANTSFSIEADIVSCVARTAAEDAREYVNGPAQ